MILLHLKVEVVPTQTQTVSGCCNTDKGNEKWNTNTIFFYVCNYNEQDWVIILTWV